MPSNLRHGYHVLDITSLKRQKYSSHFHDKNNFLYIHTTTHYMVTSFYTRFWSPISYKLCNLVEAEPRQSNMNHGCYGFGWGIETMKQCFHIKTKPSVPFVHIIMVKRISQMTTKSYLLDLSTYPSITWMLRLKQCHPILSMMSDIDLVEVQKSYDVHPPENQDRSHFLLTTKGKPYVHLVILKILKLIANSKLPPPFT